MYSWNGRNRNFKFRESLISEFLAFFPDITKTSLIFHQIIYCSSLLHTEQSIYVSEPLILIPIELHLVKLHFGAILGQPIVFLDLLKRSALYGIFLQNLHQDISCTSVFDEIKVDVSLVYKISQMHGIPCVFARIYPCD
jgi:hypothetical protein